MFQQDGALAHRSLYTVPYLRSHVHWLFIFSLTGKLSNNLDLNFDDYLHLSVVQFIM